MVDKSQPEPPKPVPATPILVNFRDLPDGGTVDNPTLLPRLFGRPADPADRDKERSKKPLCGHGITLQRRGQDLDYILRDGKTRRQVPRPRMEYNKQVTIESVTWADAPRFQSAFSITFARAPASWRGFRVNIRGEGRLEPEITFLVDPEAQPEAFLQVRTTGLMYESDNPDARGTAESPRPKRIAGARRYHFSGSRLSLYVSSNQGQTKAELTEDNTGRSIKVWPQLLDLAIYEDGKAFLTHATNVGEQLDELHLEDPFLGRGTLKPLGAPPPEGTRGKQLVALHNLGVKVEERGVRFSAFELKVAVDLIGRSRLGPRLVTAIVDRQTAELRRRGISTSQGPGLILVKDVTATGGSYNDEKGEVIIPGWIRGTIEETPTAIRHELAHTLFHAAGGMLPGTPRSTDANQQVAPLRPEIQADMNRWLNLAHQMRVVDVGPVDRPLTPPNLQTELTTWSRRVVRMMSNDHVLNDAFIELHRRFTIGDPEETGDIRGIDVADESRYMSPNARGEELGHGFDNVNEFLASFVVSTIQFQAFMTDTVARSVAQEGPKLARLYETVWKHVDQTILQLPSPNPYLALTRG